MTEINLIYPACCINGKLYTYNNGFIDGYMIGLATILLFVTLLNCVTVWYEVCKGKQTVESDNEDEREEQSEEDFEQVEEVEKTDEDKKDD